ncbi:LxmA leader domain family RiPP [Nocardiopsis valliformis]|uniref:LxmA leader domain family RiPP n=1 Tax=Nocardiopsis valliformis TaxID=239974 RepID=UPI00034D7BA7|nr:LxmA leader domain family RiPP [Nocardiopsis valliformis]
MSEKTPFDGADNYTDPAEITEDQEIENPEVTPASVAASVSVVIATNRFGC